MVKRYMPAVGAGSTYLGMMELGLSPGQFATFSASAPYVPASDYDALEAQYKAASDALFAVREALITALDACQRSLNMGQKTELNEIVVAGCYIDNSTPSGKSHLSKKGSEHG